MLLGSFLHVQTVDTVLFVFMECALRDEEHKRGVYQVARKVVKSGESLFSKRLSRRLPKQSRTPSERFYHALST